MSGSQSTVSTSRVISRLEERSEEIAVSMLERSQSEVSAYASYGDDAFRASALQHCRDHVAAFLLVAREGRQLRGAELDFVRDQARLRARQGVPLEPLLHVYRMGHAAIHDSIVDAAGASKAGLAAAIELTQRTLSHIDLITTTFTQAYLEARHAITLERGTVQRALIERALVGDIDPAGADGDEARAMGFDPDESYVVVVAVGAGDLDERLATLLHAMTGSGHFGRSAIGTVRAGEAVVLVHAERASTTRARDLATQAIAGRTGLSAGVGGVCRGLEELRRGYAQARAMARRAAPETVVSLTDLSPSQYLLLTADDDARGLVEPEVAALLAEDAARGGTLIRTLLAYLDANLSAVAAAELLFVHPNTVHYRLGRITDATGRDPRQAPQLFELVTAVRLLGLEPPSAPPAGGTKSP